MSHSCSRCGKECKDKRGLTIHEKKCGSDPSQLYSCDYCNTTYTSKQNLHRHQEKCMDYLFYVKQEEVRIQLEKRYKDTIDTLKQEISEIQHARHNYGQQVEEIKEQYQKELDVIRTKTAKEEAELRKKILFLQEDVKRTETSKQAMVNMVIHEKDQIAKELEEIKELYQQQKVIVEELRKENKDLSIERKEINQKMIIFAEKATTNAGSTTILQSNYSNHISNNLHLQHFNPSIIMGHITPPDVIIRSVSQLVDHIMKLGFSNFYRISDRSRKSILWYDEDGNPVKDSNCSMIARRVISTLRPELDRQQAFLEQDVERYSKQNNRDETRLLSMRKDLSFTRSLKEQDKMLMKDLQTEIASRAKNKNDTTVDTPKVISYINFCTRLENILLPDLTEWIDMDNKTFGEYVGKQLKDHFQVEGGSSNPEKPYIIITSDDGIKKVLYADDFLHMLRQSLEIILTTRVLPVIKDCLLTEKKIDRSRVSAILEWIRPSSTLSLSQDDTSVAFSECDFGIQIVRALVQSQTK